MTRVELPALRANDSLGFLAALGLLAVCEDGLEVRARLGWAGPDGAAVLDGPFADTGELAAALGDLTTTWHAQERPTPGTDPSLIRAPLGTKARRELGDAGALDPMKMPAAAAVERFQRMQDRELQQVGPDAGWLTALIGQLSPAKQDAPERRLTPLYSPSGQMTLRQVYRDTLEAVAGQPGVLAEAMTGWLRIEGTGANLDSRALIDAADASSGAASNRYVPGATWLALQSANWFTQVGDGLVGEAMAWTYPRGGARLRWPVWTPLLSPAAVRVLLAHPAARWAEPSGGDCAQARQSRESARRADERGVLGVCALYESRRRALTKSAGPLQPPRLLWQA